MNEGPLIVPRTLAIQILHEAQIAQPEAICGLVGARQGEPKSFVRGNDADVIARGETVWARLWSNPTAPAVPDAKELAGGGLFLVVSLNTKGVLEMRAWQLREGAPYERILKIRE
jgi:[CysO sulfur-carrier protein]-S-L-cysteine hydrolase